MYYKSEILTQWFIFKIIFGLNFWENVSNKCLTFFIFKNYLSVSITFKNINYFRFSKTYILKWFFFGNVAKNEDGHNDIQMYKQYQTKYLLSSSDDIKSDFFFFFNNYKFGAIVGLYSFH